MDSGSMFQPDIIATLANLPWALVFIYFLQQTFKQRQASQQMMIDMVDKFIAAISKCCDEQDKS